jgi:uncharacterized membrane protein
MKLAWHHLFVLIFILLAALVTFDAVHATDPLTLPIVLSSFVMFSISWYSAQHLLGHSATLKFIAIAVVFGWFAEQMGSSRGWFFGSYTYTEVLGARVGDVPVVIPLMWFALAYAGYVMGNLIICRSPVVEGRGWPQALFLSLLAAMIVTAFDLGADPYFVFVLKAWIMTKTDGWWFGETMQGFAGWVFVCVCIVAAFRWSVRNQTIVAPGDTLSKKLALVPLGIYGFEMLFQICFGYPKEVRGLCIFAMGIPLMCAFAGWLQWRQAGLATQPGVSL